MKSILLTVSKRARIAAAIIMLMITMAVVAGTWHIMQPGVSAPACTEAQTLAVFDGEESLANLLAEYAPDVAVGPVAEALGVEPTATLVSDGRGYCLPTGTTAAATKAKPAKAAPKKKTVALGAQAPATVSKAPASQGN